MDLKSVLMGLAFAAIWASAFTATRMSRPFGSGLAISKSTSESAASIGSDFWYPTAFMPGLRGGRLPAILPVALASFWQVL